MLPMHSPYDHPGNEHRIPINYPEPDFRIRVVEGKQMIWDVVRKRFIVLTPEEWVRQNFIQHLLKVKSYPAALISVEKEIRLGELKKRYDIVIYKNALPWMIVECKEPQTTIGEKTMRQILAYNMTLQVPFLVLTNGDYTLGVGCSNGRWGFMTQLPDYGDESGVSV